MMPSPGPLCQESMETQIKKNTKKKNTTDQAYGEGEMGVCREGAVALLKPPVHHTALYGIEVFKGVVVS